MNESKKRSPRYWKLWRQSGAVSSPSIKKEIFTFHKITQNDNFSDHYMWEVTEFGSEWCCMSGSLVKNVEPILNYFRIENLGKLSGRNFEIPMELGPDVSNAFELLMLIARNDGVYKSPRVQDVQNIILNAIANACTPSFDAIDSATTAQAAARIFGDDFSMSEDTFEHLQSEVSRRSQKNIFYSYQIDPNFPLV